MKKLIFAILLLLGFVLAETPKNGWAYVISAIGVKNSPNNVVYTSGDTSADSNATYVLSPQVIVWDDTLNYVGSLTPFTGCLNSQHYSNGEPSGFCFTGGLATTKQDGLMSKEDKTALDNAVSDISTIKSDISNLNYDSPWVRYHGVATKNGLSLTIDLSPFSLIDSGLIIISLRCQGENAGGSIIINQGYHPTLVSYSMHNEWGGSIELGGNANSGVYLNINSLGSISGGKVNYTVLWSALSYEV